MAENATVGILRVLLTANSAEFDTGMKKAGASTRALKDDLALTASAVSKLAGAFGITLGAGALIGFGKQMLDAADATVKLSDKTGIAIEPLQRLQYVAEQSGNSIEQVSSAVSQMQRRLAEGDKSAVGAVTALGLSMSQLIAQSPDEQFLSIAREVAKIEDPMKRTQVAMDLFGRAGAELLPTLVANVDELAKQAPVMSEKATKAFDMIGDAMARALTGSKNLVANGIGAMIDGYTRLGQTVGALVDRDLTKVALILADQADVTLPKVRDNIDDLKTSYDHASLSAGEMDRISKELTKSVEDQSKKSEEAKKSQDQLFGRDLIAKAQDFARQLGDVSNVSKLTKEKKDELRTAVEKAMDAYAALGQRAPANLRAILEATTPLLASTARLSTNFVPLVSAVEDTGESIHWLASGPLNELGEATSAADEAMQKWADKMGARYPAAIRSVGAALVETTEKTGLFSGLLDSLGDTIVRAFEGGGNVVKSIGSTIGRQLGANVAKEFGGAITGALGKTFGNLVNSLLPGVGALLGPLASKIGGWFKGLFGGVSAEVKQARSDVDAFQQKLADTLTATQRAEVGGERWKMTVIAVRDAYLATGRSAADAERIVKQLWDTDHPERAKAAIEQINAVLAESQRIIEGNQQALNDARAEMDRLTDEAKIDWKSMQEAAERYGVDLASLGPKFQSGRLHESAQQIWNDFILLTRGGADVGGVLLGMKDEIVALADESVRFGVQIPENFRPLIANLLESNELTEEERLKLRALGAENFGDPIVSKLDAIATRMGELIDKIGELADRLARNVPQAAQAAATGIASAFSGLSVNVPVNFDVGSMPDVGFDIPHLATGGIVTQPTLAMIGERGPEAVIPLDGTRAGGIGDRALRAEVSGLRADIKNLIRGIPEQWRQAVVAANAFAPRRSY